jgi:hypothetical protein
VPQSALQRPERERPHCRILDELRACVTAANRDALLRVARELERAASDLGAAADADEAEPAVRDFEHKRSFGEVRRQHTPQELDAIAASVGFRPVAVAPVHPHPMPPALERLAPRVFNRLALAWQRALEPSPLGLAFCSAFVAVYERP